MPIQLAMAIKFAQWKQINSPQIVLRQLCWVGVIKLQKIYAIGVPDRPHSAVNMFMEARSWFSTGELVNCGWMAVFSTGWSKANKLEQTID